MKFVSATAHDDGRATGGASCTAADYPEPAAKFRALRDGASHGSGRVMRTIDELVLDFKRRQAHRLRAPQELSKGSQREEVVYFRPLEELTDDFKQRRCRPSGQGKAEEPLVYDRVQMLGVLAALKAAPSSHAGPGIRAVQVPPPAPGLEQVASEHCCSPEDTSNPYLNDASILAGIEARLSHEPGADVVGAGAFGDDGPEWSFEQAVQSNKAGKALDHESPLLSDTEVSPSTAASGDETTFEPISECDGGDTMTGWGAEHLDASLWGTGFSTAPASSGHGGDACEGLETPAYLEPWYLPYGPWDLGCVNYEGPWDLGCVNYEGLYCTSGHLQEKATRSYYDI